MRYPIKARQGVNLGGFLLRGVLVRAHVIALTHFNTVVAQQRIGSGDVEEELRQTVAQQVSLTAEALLFGVPGRVTISMPSLPLICSGLISPM